MSYRKRICLTCKKETEETRCPKCGGESFETTVCEEPPQLPSERIEEIYQKLLKTTKEDSVAAYSELRSGGSFFMELHNKAIIQYLDEQAK